MSRPARKRFVIAAALAVVLVLLARELGVVDLQAQVSYSNTMSQKELRGQDAFGPDLHLEVLDGEQRYVHFFSSGGSEPLAVTARLTRYDLSGWTWTPLYKRVRVEYEVEIVSSDPAVGGSISGTIEKTSRGLISRRSFCEGLREGIRAIVFDSLEP